MLDTTLNVYLLEINSSPSMEYSTVVTKNIVQKGLTGLVSCVLDGQYKDGDISLRKPSEVRNRYCNIDGWDLIVATQETKVKQGSLSLATSEVLRVTGQQLRNMKRRRTRKAAFFKQEFIE